jgi:hypothetical protein
MTNRWTRGGLRWLLVLGAVGGTLWSASARAQAIQSQETNIAGIVAEVVECKRQDGVLTVRMRLRNTSDKEIRVDLISDRNYDSYYVTAGSKKYLVLRDSERTPLAPSVDIFGKVATQVAKGAAYLWWARYPAPPADVKKVSYFTPLTPPFDNIPIAD